MKEFRSEYDDEELEDFGKDEEKEQPGPGKRRILAMKRKIRTLTFVSVLAVITAFLAVASLLIVLIKTSFSTGESGGIFVKMNEKTESGKVGEAESEEAEESLEAIENEYKAEGEQEMLRTIRQSLEDGSSVLSVLRGLYPDTVVYLDSGRYYFHTVNTDLQLSEFMDENFVTDENGRMTYMGDDGVITHAGIDVSKFQGEIDWAKVKESGIEFAIIRAGLRGYGAEGKIVEDETYRANIEGAIANGIKVGVYFFSQAVNEEEAKEEAQTILDLVEGYPLDYPIYIDIEQVADSASRTRNVSPETRTAVVRTFLSVVEGAGYQGGIYGNLKSFLMLLDVKQLEEYPKWYAAYSMPLYYPYRYHMLQYSENGNVDGINGHVDMNIFFE
ncbi:MAG: glycoside hydrolase family 25 protein [Lachnospiraceae bacterium]|nr:glycoside hydrolase family 25 protein [Lachnospiraceae bacterium]